MHEIKLSKNIKTQSVLPIFVIVIPLKCPINKIKIENN